MDVGPACVCSGFAILLLGVPYIRRDLGQGLGRMAGFWPVGRFSISQSQTAASPVPALFPETGSVLLS